MNITTKYNIDENDYLAFYLFYHSTNKNKKKSQKSFIKKVLSSIPYLIFVFYIGYYLYSVDKTLAQNIGYFVLGLLGVIVLFFIIDKIMKKATKKHFLKHIRKVQKPSFDEVTFTDNTIDIKNETGKWSINLSQFVEINETEKYYFLHFTTLGQAIIIPKEKIDNLSEIEQAIKDISQKYNIKHNVNLNWKY